MRILLVNKFFYRKGGSETYLFALADGLQAMGHEVAFFAMHHPKNYQTKWNKYFVSEKEYNNDISAFRKIHEALTIAYSPEAKRKFETLLEDFRPDVIHLNLVHRQITFSILDAPYLRKHRVPIVYTAHDYSLICPVYTMLNGKGKICDACINGDFTNVIKNVCTKNSKAKSMLSYLEAEYLKHHKVYNKINLIIACSQFMKQKLDEAGYGNRTIYMQNFLTDRQVMMGKKYSNTHKYEDMAAGQRPYFFFFIRLSKEKGILTLVNSFIDAAGLKNTQVGEIDSIYSANAYYKNNNSIDENKLRRVLSSNWDLHIVGEGPEYSTIKYLILRAGPEAQKRIKLLGYMTGEDLQQEVGNARFSVMPSEWYENMPYSGIESLAAQTPIIGANIGGISELINNTGFMFQSGDTDSLRNILCITSELSPEEYNFLQNSCKKYILEKTNQKKYLTRLIGLYKTLL